MLHDCGEHPLLGAVLLEQGALRDDELQHGLAVQTDSGERLGQILIELGLVSRPEVDRAVAGQRGVELEHERGYGFGLRAAIESRHRHRRGLAPLLERALGAGG